MSNINAYKSALFRSRSMGADLTPLENPHLVAKRTDDAVDDYLSSYSGIEFPLWRLDVIDLDHVIYDAISLWDEW